MKNKRVETKKFKFRTYPTANCLAEISKDNSQFEASNRITWYEDLNGWQKLVVDWWNDYVNNGHYHKRPQLYLHGTNTGKTTFIKNLLSLCVYDEAVPWKIQLENVDDELEPYIFIPVANSIKYAFQSFDSTVHLISYIDEFNIKHWDVSSLKKFLAGEPLVTAVRYEKQSHIQSTLPTIIVSNKKPPTVDMHRNYIGFAERIIEVEAV